MCKFVWLRPAGAKGVSMQHQHFYNQKPTKHLTAKHQVIITIILSSC